MFKLSSYSRHVISLAALTVLASAEDATASARRRIRTMHRLAKNSVPPAVRRKLMRMSPAKAAHMEYIHNIDKTPCVRCSGQIGDIDDPNQGSIRDYWVD